MDVVALLQASRVTVNDTWIDYLIIGIYFAFTIGIGLALRKKMKTSEDFFLSGRALPSWVTGIAFMAANLGALEILGMGASAAQYGIMQAHFYWTGGAIGMVFAALFIVPIYYGSRTHSVPGYLKLRYNEATRGFNAVGFAILTVLMSGINMYAMAIVFKLLLGWSIGASIWLSAAITMSYVLLGGLSSSIYNEVLQFFLIVLGILPVTLLGLFDAGGWSGLKERVDNEALFHLWSGTAGQDNPMAVSFLGIILGLGFVLSFGYFSGDFLVVQRALAAKDEGAAKRTPLVAAFPKIFFPFLAIFPGLIVLSVVPGLGSTSDPANSYNMAIPYAMANYLPSGVLGVALTALMASFMSGMAGNVTAFNTIWTYDIYRAYINRDAPDRHYLNVGRFITVAGVVISVGTAYVVLAFQSIMDYVQLLFSLFSPPLLAAILLGMLWKRTTAWGGFAGIAGGTAFVGVLYALELTGGIVYGSAMAGNFWRAIWAFLFSVGAMFVVSLLTRPKTDEDLKELVWSLRERKRIPEPTWYKRPWILATAAIALVVFFNIIFF